MKSWVNLLNAFQIRLQRWISFSALINQKREHCFYLNQVRNGELAGVQASEKVGNGGIL